MFNELNEVEKFIYKEYTSWCKAAKLGDPANFEYAFIQADLYKQRAFQYPRLKKLLFNI